MSAPAFDDDELVVVGQRMVFGEMLDVYRTPITFKENMKRTVAGNPLWQCSVNDYNYMTPRCCPDSVAKGNVTDVEPGSIELGGKDMFGITWEFEPEIGGSTVRPGHPTLLDASEWPEKIVFPTKADIDSWDWEGSKAATLAFSDPDTLWEPLITSGFFERLISFMDFENALVAMIDEDQQPAVHALFDKLADLYIMLIDKFLEVFPGQIDALCLHDDWGHQSAPFFSLDTIMEMVVPYMKRVTDHAHGRGLLTEVHSCGKDDVLVPGYIAGGFQLYECQPLLDFDTLVPEYGDRIKFHVTPDVPAPDAPASEHEAAARAFIDKVVEWGHPVMLEVFYTEYPVQPAFWKELYRYSRIRFAEAFN